MKTQQYNVTGMSCAACSSSVQRVVTRLQGVESCDVNLITGKMTVTFNENLVSSLKTTREMFKEVFDIKRTKNKIKEQLSDKYLDFKTLTFQLTIFINLIFKDNEKVFRIPDGVCPHAWGIVLHIMQ